MRQDEISQVLHASGLAKGRGMSYQASVLLRVAQRLCDEAGIDITTLQWWQYSQREC